MFNHLLCLRRGLTKIILMLVSLINVRYLSNKILPQHFLTLRIFSRVPTHFFMIFRRQLLHIACKLGQPSRFRSLARLIAQRLHTPICTFFAHSKECTESRTNISAFMQSKCFLYIDFLIFLLLHCRNLWPLYIPLLIIGNLLLSLSSPSRGFRHLTPCIYNKITQSFRYF